MFFRRIHAGKNEEELATDMFAVRELVYYALCRPEEFKVWVNTNLSIEDQASLKKASDALRSAMFFTEKIIDGGEVNSLRADVFYLELESVRLLANYCSSLDALQAASADVERGKKQLQADCQELQKHMVERKRIVDSTGSWCGLPHEEQSTLTLLLLNVNSVLEQQSAVLQAIIADNPMLQQLSQLSLLQQLLRGKMTALFEKQIASERVAINLDALHGLQDAVANLMGGEDLCEKGKRWFVTFMQSNQSYCRAVKSAMPLMQRLQVQFSAYLSKQKPLLLQSLSSLQHRAEEADVNKYRRLVASQAYQIRVQQENQASEARLFQERQAVADNFKEACTQYNAGNITESLRGFTRGAKKWHAISCYSVGNMLLKGQGCSQDPFLARYYFMLAFALEDVRTTRVAYAASIMKADEKLLSFVPAPALEDDDLSIELKAMMMDDAAIMKSIMYMKVSIVDRLFRLGELLVLIIVSRSKNQQDESAALLRRAVYFFEYAYRYSNDMYNRKCAVVENSALTRAWWKNKRDVLIKDIVDQLDMVADYYPLQALQEIMTEFYSRYRFKDEATQAAYLSV